MYIISCYNINIEGIGLMKKDNKMYNKSNTICIRLTRKELDKLEYLRLKLDLRDLCKVIRELIDAEFNRR